MTYEEGDAFSVTAGGFLLIQRQHSGVQTDLAVFAPNAWLYAEVVQEPQPGSRRLIRYPAREVPEVSLACELQRWARASRGA